LEECAGPVGATTQLHYGEMKDPMQAFSAAMQYNVDAAVTSY